MAKVFDTTMLPDISTDAKFRALGQWFGSQLVAMGFVKTADTGQIDWATVLKPTGASQGRGFEVYAANDALAAASPFVVRVEYGSSNWNANSPRFRVTVGIRTDGAGNIALGEGTMQPAVFCDIIGYWPGPIAWLWGTTPISLFSGDAGRFTTALWVNHNNQAGIGYLSIERTKDSRGNDTGEGLLIRWGLGTGGNGQHTTLYLPLQDTRASMGGVNALAKFDVLLPGLTTTAIHDQHPIVSAPVQWFDDKLIPGLDLLVGIRGEFAAFTPVTIVRYGSRPTPYLPIPSANLSNLDRAGSNQTCLLLRWE